MGAEVIIAGGMEPRAIELFRDFGIEAWIAPPGINAGIALLMLEAGSLEQMEWSPRRSETTPRRVVPAG
jgi:predicted Fe-Mo cluster-binding NifX family protein